MENTPYEPPASDVDVYKEVEVPKEILKKIKSGWIASLISASVNLIIILTSLVSHKESALFDVWTLIDVVLVYVLAFFYFRKSRIASTLMFCYFIYAKIYIIYETGRPDGIILSLVFLYFFFQGMMGTYQYHKILKNN